VCALIVAVLRCRTPPNVTEAAGLRGLKNVDPGDEAAAAAAAVCDEQTDERQQPRRSFDDQQEDSAMLAAAAADGVITRGGDGGTETAAGESVDAVARRSDDADSAVRRTSAEGCPTVSRADDQCDRLDGVRPADDGVAAAATAADSSRKAPSPSRGALVTSRGAEMTSRGVEKMAVDGRREAVAAAGSDEDTER